MTIERDPEIEDLLRRAYEAHQQGDPGPMTLLISQEAVVTALGSDPAERYLGTQGFANMLRADEDGDWKIVLWTVTLVRNEALEAAWPPN